MTHIVSRGWLVSENIFEELDLEKATICDGCENPGVPVSSVQVVECPLDFVFFDKVKEDMAIKVLKNTQGDLHGYQPLYMKNPISRLSISGDEGKTWIGLNQEERSATFLHPKQFDSSLNVTIRVDGWMGGSSVQVNMGPLPFPDGALTLAKGNNVCRGNLNDHAYSKLLATILLYIAVFQATASISGQHGQYGANAQRPAPEGRGSGADMLSGAAEARALEGKTQRRRCATHKHVLAN